MLSTSFSEDSVQFDHKAKKKSFESKGMDFENEVIVTNN
jgi:hypothetical protein